MKLDPIALYSIVGPGHTSGKLAPIDSRGSKEKEVNR